MTRIRFDGCDLSPRSARAPRFAHLIALLLAVALAATAAGCGGSSRMSKPDYERTVNDAGRQLSAVFGNIDQNATNLHQLDVRVTRARRTLDRVRKTLEDGKPPKDAERAHRSLLIALQSLSTDLGQLARAARSGSRSSVQEARARLAAPGRQLIAAIQQLQQAGYDINNG
jgi:hypothetical protein